MGRSGADEVGRLAEVVLGIEWLWIDQKCKRNQTGYAYSPYFRVELNQSDLKSRSHQYGKTVHREIEENENEGLL